MKEALKNRAKKVIKEVYTIEINKSRVVSPYPLGKDLGWGV
jgi:hypothetical protein